jgi:site-specific recombinase XerD
MKQKNLEQWSISNTEHELDDLLLEWLDFFLIDRKAQNMAIGTIYFYQKKLELFAQYCGGQAIDQIRQITPNILREYLFWLERNGHNPGGVHACYRAVKTFLRWWENETEPANWTNPIKKVKQPRTSIEPLEPVTLETVKAMLADCEKGSFFGIRDHAIILFLYDTGCRAAELCSINLVDYNQVSGEVLIREGKGRKPRRVFLGKKARRAMRAYFKIKPECIALWCNQQGERLTYWGLNLIIKRRAESAGVEKPGLHDFRRAFALNMLRAGVDVHSLASLMGHADLQILKRYLKQTSEDLRKAHELGSPVDNHLKGK